MKKSVGRQTGVSRRQAMQGGLNSWALATLFGAAARSLGADATTAPALADAVSMTSQDLIEPQKFAWVWIRWLMNSKIDPKAEMTLGIVQIEANMSNPLHVHPNCTEYMHVLSGSCKHRVGNKWVSVKAGDTVRIPKGVIHRAITGAEPILSVIVYDTGTRIMTPVDEPKEQK